MIQTITNTYYGVTSSLYYRDTGETIPRHQHPFDHTTQVVRGRTRVDLFGKPPVSFEMTFTDPAYVIPPNVDHEITALDDGTVILNVSTQNAYDKEAATGGAGGNGQANGTGGTAGGGAGGVMLDCGEVIPAVDLVAAVKCVA